MLWFQTPSCSSHSTQLPFHSVELELSVSSELVESSLRLTANTLFCLRYLLLAWAALFSRFLNSTKRESLRLTGPMSANVLCLCKRRWSKATFKGFFSGCCARKDLRHSSVHFCMVHSALPTVTPALPALSLSENT